MRICLDAGHGMGNLRAGSYDPGAVSGGVAEADATLLFALAGKAILPQYGIEVFLTRDDATDNDPVGKRASKAMAAKCDLFLALHCNSGPSSASGQETFYRDAADLAFAKLVQAAALKAMGGPDRKLKTEKDSQHTRLAIFDFVGPAALVELGFISHYLERSLLFNRNVRIAFWHTLGAALKAAYQPGKK